MYHDIDRRECVLFGENCKKLGSPRVLNGEKCYGYMDYEYGESSGDYTNRWSHCSVHDFKNFVRRGTEGKRSSCRRVKQPFCLKSLGGESEQARPKETAYDYVDTSCMVLHYVKGLTLPFFMVMMISATVFCCYQRCKKRSLENEEKAIKNPKGACEMEGFLAVKPNQSSIPINHTDV